MDSALLLCLLPSYIRSLLDHEEEKEEGEDDDDHDDDNNNDEDEPLRKEQGR